jgi:hypothetical protein
MNARAARPPVWTVPKKKYIGPSPGKKKEFTEA